MELLKSVHNVLDALAEAGIDAIMLWQEWRCKRARHYLLTHDHSYRDHHAGMEIARRRQRLYEMGVSPLDPVIPDRWSVEKDLPPMSWPNKSMYS